MRFSLRRHKGKQSPLFPQAVIGYRAWLTQTDALAGIMSGADPADYPVRLFPLIGGRGRPWQPGENIASCDRGRHHAPNKQCHCGLYAFYKLRSARRKLGGRLGEAFGMIGAIAAAGDVQCHADGYRAEKAQIIALLASRRNPHCEEVAAYYRVPLFHDKREMQAYVLGLAKPVPRWLRPPRAILALSLLRWGLVAVITECFLQIISPMIGSDLLQHLSAALLLPCLLLYSTGLLLTIMQSERR